MSKIVWCENVLLFILQILRLSESFIEDPSCSGRTAQNYTYPWQAAIYDNEDKFACGGSVITTFHILTAAHCAEGETGWYIQLGMTDMRAKDGVRFELLSWIIHPGFHLRESASWNDIAIGYLTPEIKFDYHIQPVCLNDNPDLILDSKIAKISGWGSLKQRGLYPDYLQEAEVEIYSDRRCKKSKLGYYYRPEIMMCASSYPMDSCSGDSGGPLVLDSGWGYMFQVGIVSFGIGCGLRGSAGAYARVSTYYDWIQEVTKNVKTCSTP
ncbi:serine protease 44-like isoform X2 [Hermetia illucens]|uniref:serine protease 44-like isoform X2 n=1 Tax=Hermetia illucens TaxID=343691 RepID=UPI0018CC30B4|nr:serine protease 44-like isoform X2 [Hermetia illucens]